MNSNLTFDARQILQLFVIDFVCNQSIIQKKNKKKKKITTNGPASKFTFEVISWLLSYENHSCLLLMKGKYCDN